MKAYYAIPILTAFRFDADKDSNLTPAEQMLSRIMSRRLRGEQLDDIASGQVESRPDHIFEAMSRVNAKAIVEMQAEFTSRRYTTDRMTVVPLLPSYCGLSDNWSTAMLRPGDCIQNIYPGGQSCVALCGFHFLDSEPAIRRIRVRLTNGFNVEFPLEGDLALGARHWILSEPFVAPPGENLYLQLTVDRDCPEGQRLGLVGLVAWP